MGGNRLDVQRAVRCLIDAVQFGDRQAAANHGVSVRTVRSYRQRIKTDPNLAQAFRDLAIFENAKVTHKVAEQDAAWRGECRAAISSLIADVRNVARKASDLVADEKAPRTVAKVLLAVSESVDRLMQMELTIGVLSAGPPRTDEPIQIATAVPDGD